MQRGGCTVSVVISSRERHLLLADAVASLLDGDEVADEIVVVDQSARPHPTLPGEAAEPGAFAPATTTRVQRVEYRGRVGEDVLFPNSMAVWRTAFDEVGLFDERLGAGAHFPSSEDNDWGYRLLEAGYTIVYEPDIIAHHRAWRSRAAWVPLRWSYGRGQGAYFAKWLSLRDSYMSHRLWRDLKTRYKQTVLGVSWAIIQPIVTMVVFSVFFGRLARVPSAGLPYPLF